MEKWFTSQLHKAITSIPGFNDLAYGVARCPWHSESQACLLLNLVAYPFQGSTACRTPMTTCPSTNTSYNRQTSPLICSTIWCANSLHKVWRDLPFVSSTISYPNLLIHSMSSHLNLWGAILSTCNLEKLQRTYMKWSRDQTKRYVLT